MDLNFSVNVSGNKHDLIEKLTSIIDSLGDMDDAEFYEEGTLYLTSGAAVEITG